MKKINHLSVTVNYKVGLGGANVSEKVFKQLNEIADSGSEIDSSGMEYPEAVEWLRNNVKERDCYHLEYNIDELT